MKGGSIIEKTEQFNLLMNQYYAAILRYCKQRLQNDEFAAEECTQDIFMLLFKKMPTLDLNDNILGWLYAAADRLTRNYIKRNRRRLESECISLDEIRDLPVSQSDVHNEYFRGLTEEEYALLNQYYASDSFERRKIAEGLGLSMDALYQRIRTIKHKVKRDK